MNALTIGLALLVMGCAALEHDAPALDSAATKAQQTGGCIMLRCAYFPVACRPAAGRCERN